MNGRSWKGVVFCRGGVVYLDVAVVHVYEYDVFCLWSC